MIGDDDEHSPLTDADKAAHEEAIKHIDGLLEGEVGDSHVWRELQRERGHMVDELVAGVYLPLPEKTED